MEFTNPETAARYEALTDSFLVITKQQQYHGMLSNIPPDDETKESSSSDTESNIGDNFTVPAGAS